MEISVNPREMVYSKTDGSKDKVKIVESKLKQ